MRLLKRLASAIGLVLLGGLRALPALMRDAVGSGGVALMTYGIWQIFPPAAFIFCGLALLIASILLARRGAS